MLRTVATTGFLTSVVFFHWSKMTTQILLKKPLHLLYSFDAAICFNYVPHRTVFSVYSAQPMTACSHSDAFKFFKRPHQTVVGFNQLVIHLHPLLLPRQRVEKPVHAVESLVAPLCEIGVGIN